ncbi:MAG: hypothetical protein K6E78_06930 [Treponema sp.]|nr:hypothetical protein [Treponema sp.]
MFSNDEIMEFKTWLRDKGKYNLVNWEQIMTSYNEFLDERYPEHKIFHRIKHLKRPDEEAGTYICPYVPYQGSTDKK